MKIVVAGGTGFIGHELIKRYAQMGREVFVVSRRPIRSKKIKAVFWEDEPGLIEALEGVDMLINLAGKSVNCRYNRKNKEEILLSRLETTIQLGRAVSQCKSPPKLWINASTATIYRHSEDRPMTEQDGEIGSTFSELVAQRWEETFFDFDLPNTRQVALRMAIVMANSGGAFPMFRELARIGLGGKHGSGKQMFSFVHIDDVFESIEFIQQKKLDGIINLSCPAPVTNRLFVNAMRSAFGLTIALNLEKWLLELGAFMMRTETELLLKSRWVLPQRLVEEGFQFRYGDIHETLAALRRKS
jgi:uncharacterized protein (TIGR01777 family)